MGKKLLTFDERVGQKIKSVREIRGYSQAHIAQQIGVTFQQIQKYEKGANRISVERLCLLSKVLGVSPLMLMGLEKDINKNSLIMDLLGTQDLKMISYWKQIKCPFKQDAILQLIKDFSKH